jgi:hypothetical protein
MADIQESIRTWLIANIPNVHIGEDIPQEVVFPYVWFMRSGDTQSESLNCQEDISIFFDVEVVSDDISQARILTERVKRWFRKYVLHSIEFDLTLPGDSIQEVQTIQAFRVSNHDDQYLPFNLQLDNRLHVGSFVLEAILGEPSLKNV